MSEFKTAFFIARKMIKNADNQRISKPVVRVSIVGIVLSVTVMMIALSVVTGFQKEVRNKVVGFGAHYQITEFSDNQSFESSPMLKDQSFYPSITEIDGVTHIQIYAYKPAILQSNKDTISYSFVDEDGEEKDTTRADRNIKGVISKGVSSDFSWDFFDQYLVDGTHLSLDHSEAQPEIMISQKIADQLRFEVGDEIQAYFIQNTGPIPKRLTIKAIYKTGLEDFDNDLVYLDIRHLQELNKWGISADLAISDSCYSDYMRITAYGNGGNGNYKYNFGNGQGWRSAHDFLYCPKNDTVIQVAVSDFSRSMHPSKQEMLSIPDTAVLKIDVEGKGFYQEGCFCKNNDHISNIQYKDSSKTMEFGETTITFTMSNTGGSSGEYVGGFELFVENWGQIKTLRSEIKDYVPPTIHPKPINEIYPEIFNWLGFLDTNVYIILILVLFVAIINMSSALLVMILERTNFIGLMKAMGSRNKLIRKVFLVLSGHILLRGLLWGNVISLSLLLIQHFFGVIQLNPEVYYVSTAPVNIDWVYIIGLNILTLVICLLVLILPAMFITRIKPVKAIKFN